MNNKSKYFDVLRWIGICSWNVLKELLVLIFLWLFFWWINSMSLYFNDPTGAVTSFYSVVLGLPIGYLVIGFLRRGFRGLLIPVIVVLLLLVTDLFSWMHYPKDAVETPFLGLPLSLFFCFFLLTFLVALGQGIATTFTGEKPLQVVHDGDPSWTA